MKSTHQLPSVSIPIESSAFFNRGLLTSRYKEEIRENFQNISSTSLFGLKQRVKINQHRFAPVVGTILKISVFVLAYIIAFV
ncbi:hypothetical protein [Kordia zhangzhouensis]|uniref:hypothetical protein n=1 Tax=Kordia zhangzhouensis TaxID=1620405 RepID=UPI0012E04CDA|nr:hypothetical protein [Kordia zhangzhouensis]